MSGNKAKSFFRYRRIATIPVETVGVGACFSTSGIIGNEE